MHGRPPQCRLTESRNSTTSCIEPRRLTQRQSRASSLRTRMLAQARLLATTRRSASIYRGSPTLPGARPTALPPAVVARARSFANVRRGCVAHAALRTFGCGPVSGDFFQTQRRRLYNVQWVAAMGVRVRRLAGGGLVGRGICLHGGLGSGGAARGRCRQRASGHSAPSAAAAAPASACALDASARRGEGQGR